MIARNALFRRGTVQLKRHVLLPLLPALVIFCGYGRGGVSSSPSAVSAGSAASEPPAYFSTSAAGPVIFYSDLISGPNAGGENNDGAFVTIYGKGFGTSQESSSVTIGSHLAASYLVWNDTQVTFQLGPNAHTGNIVVQVPGEGASNGVPFTVRPGEIYFVARGGSDGDNGSFDSPWASLQHAEDSMRPGDITYAQDGVSAITCTQYSGTLNLYNAGAPGEPLAIVAYPGASVYVGSLSCPRGIVAPGISQHDDLAPAPFSHWVIAGLHIEAQTEAIDLFAQSSDYRVIGNNITCPRGIGQTGCVVTESGNDFIKFLGNTVQDVGVVGPNSKYYHGVYFGTDADHIEVGWNTISNVGGCRGIQFFSEPNSLGQAATTGLPQYDIVVHDNVVHNTVCDGINLATVDASKGPVLVFNNIIYNAGDGPDPPGGLADYACIYVANEAYPLHPLVGGRVEIFNNTLYNCGHREDLGYKYGYGSAGAISIGEPPGARDNSVVMTDNIIFEIAGEQYLSGESDNSVLRGTNNDWFGAGPPPDQTLDNLNIKPDFVNAASFNFQLLPESPLEEAGVAVNLGSITSEIMPDLGSLLARDIGSAGSAPDLGAQ